MGIKHYRGRLGYISCKDGKENGREWYSGTIFEDGSCTHRAVCQLDGEWGVMRDITVTTNKNYEPLDCFARMRRNGRLEGTAYVNFYDDRLECEANTREFGRVSQTLAYGARPKLFTTHAVSSGDWVATAYNHKSGEKQQRVKRSFHLSPTPDGSTGPLVGTWDIDIIYRGEVEITVPAGTFQCEHYSWWASDMPWAHLESYVFGPQKQLAKLTWETLDHDFDLMEYEEFD